MSTKVSIIIPVFNSEKTLEKCLKSIVNQTFDMFEIVILDNCSVDRSLTIAQMFYDNRIKIYSGKDNGIYDAMNKGISLATGDWIYFLGSDDYFFDSSILKNITKHFNTEVDVVYGNVIIDSKLVGKKFILEDLFQENICHQSIFYRRNVFEKIGTFNLKYLASADWDHTYRWMSNKNIKKNYVNETIAVFTLGGFSTFYYDNLFRDDLDWLFLLKNKSEITFFDKLRMIKAKLKKDFSEKRTQNIVKTFFQIPYFLTK